MSVRIAAPAATVHEVLIDVDRWPEWLPTVTSVARRASGPLQIGQRVTVRQPRLPAGRWEVTRLAPGQGFTWRARFPGVVTEARHEIESLAGGEVLLTLGVRQSGPLAGLLAPLTAALTRRYIATEAASLKTRVEAHVDREDHPAQGGHA